MTTTRELSITPARLAVEAQVARIIAAFGPVVRSYGTLTGIEVDMGRVVLGLLDRIDALEAKIGAKT